MATAGCPHGCDCLARFKEYLVHVAVNPEVQEFINEKWIETKKKFPLEAEPKEFQAGIEDEVEEEGDSESEQSEIFYPSSEDSETCFGDNCGCQGGDEDCVPNQKGRGVPPSGNVGGSDYVQHFGEYKGVNSELGKVNRETLQIG